ncbi:D-alanyl-D-alanine endopeptidase [Hahella sp. KA22]|uniref:D-alanyl-D-alanine endopeptidase n=1 Tax=Hahella sp. KA22 TaxID=1628392 RepID=UPI000FDD6B6A|nr:D-alanyl-D-alanine endopeptidase [Hahella sp. KA22]AZZ94154.1 D-alanyl-D-alanine endopeptidase [Hahella sp. KA22]QAY57528.1 D-alanyl-D-alanine endopeptidase [Hahella sp. KA22]
MKNILIALSLLFCSSVVLADSETTLPENLQSLDTSNISLGSVNAKVVDVESGVTLFAKNPETVAPIASISKLMTAMVVLDAELPLDEMVTITEEDVDTWKNTYSRMRIGAVLPRSELLLLALMSSENRAALALGRSYPGGMSAFVNAMNDKARALNMRDTRFVEPSGLSMENVSTASDLVRMVSAASRYKLIRDYTTTPSHLIKLGETENEMEYRNTNLLVRQGEWGIRLSKTGFINEAGRCLVMMADVGERPVAIVLLDSYGRRTPIGDANRIKQWMVTGKSAPVAGAALKYEQEKNSGVFQTAAMDDDTQS